LKECCADEKGNWDKELLKSIANMQSSKGMISDADFQRLKRDFVDENGKLDKELLKSIASMQNKKGMISKEDFDRLKRDFVDENRKLDKELLKSITSMQSQKGMISDADFHRLKRDFVDEKGKLDKELLKSIASMQSHKGMISDADFHRLKECCADENGKLDKELLKSIANMQSHKGMISDADFHRLKECCADEKGNWDKELLKSIANMQSSKGMIEKEKQKQLETIRTKFQNTRAADVFLFQYTIKNKIKNIEEDQEMSYFLSRLSKYNESQTQEQLKITRGFFKSFKDCTKEDLTKINKILKKEFLTSGIDINSENNDNAEFYSLMSSFVLLGKNILYKDLSFSEKLYEIEDRLSGKNPDIINLIKKFYVKPESRDKIKITKDLYSIKNTQKTEMIDEAMEEKESEKDEFLEGNFYEQIYNFALEAEKSPIYDDEKIYDENDNFRIFSGDDEMYNPPFNLNSSNSNELGRM